MEEAYTSFAEMTLALKKAHAEFKRKQKKEERVNPRFDLTSRYEALYRVRRDAHAASAFSWPDTEDVPALIKAGGNPYLQFWEQHCGHETDIFMRMSEAPPPPAFADPVKNRLALQDGLRQTAADSWIDMAFLQHKARDFATLFYSWAVPDPAGLKAILDLDEQVVDIGCGRSYWSWQLRQLGAKVVPFEPARYVFHWTETERRLPDRWRSEYAALFCWPSCGELWSGRLLSQFKGETVIYVGEGAGGCTGNDRFHQLLADRFEQVEQVYIPRWQYLHDLLVIYKRK